MERVGALVVGVQEGKKEIEKGFSRAASVTGQCAA